MAKTEIVVKPRRMETPLLITAAGIIGLSYDSAHVHLLHHMLGSASPYAAFFLITALIIWVICRAVNRSRDIKWAQEKEKP